jgi:hypothetical protein
MPLDGSNRACVVCGADISHLHGHSQTCQSGGCRARQRNWKRKELRARESAGKKVDLITRVCSECEKDISHSRSDAHTCGDDCNRKRRLRLSRIGKVCVVCSADISRLHGLTNTCAGVCREAYRRKMGTIKAREWRNKNFEGGRTRPERCEVCGAAGRINFDHDHYTGDFRGWLCHGCNVALGYAKDDPLILRALADYLERQSL